MLIIAVTNVAISFRSIRGAVAATEAVARLSSSHTLIATRTAMAIFT